MSSAERKPTEDFSERTDAAIPHARALAVSSDLLPTALEHLYALEKQTRAAADLASTTRLLIAIIDLCHAVGAVEDIAANLTLMSKKHGQLKQAVVEMVKHAMALVDAFPMGADTLDSRLRLITVLREIAEGKIYVEAERADLTLRQARILEHEQGDVAKAASVLQEIAIETYGSVSPRRKTEFILEQMRTCMDMADWSKAQIISRKINTKFFAAKENWDLKQRYYALMVRYAEAKEEWLQVARHWWQLFETLAATATATTATEGNESVNAASSSMDIDAVVPVAAETGTWREALRSTMLFACLAPNDTDQSDLLHRAHKHTLAARLQPHANLVRQFTTAELMPWPEFVDAFGPALRTTPTFDPLDAAGTKRWQELRKRVIEHNIRVIAAYYTRVRMTRLAELLSLPEEETESTLAEQVVAGVVYAKIDRPAGIVVFEKTMTAHEKLNVWRRDIDQVLDLVETVEHWISKEEMVHAINKATA